MVVDAQELTDHLELTCSMIRRHRSRMLPGGIGYTDAPTFGGFGPKSPCSEHAMELGDLEAAFVGNLARYCMAMGTIPRKPIRGFWWVNGVCRGVKGGLDEDEFDLWGNHDGTNYLAPIIPTINLLIEHAEDVVNTEGVDELLEAGRDTRWYGEKMFPTETGEWITEEEAQKVTGRTKRTLGEWRRSGVVQCLKGETGTEYYKPDLEMMVKIKMGNMLRGTLCKPRV